MKECYFGMSGKYWSSMEGRVRRMQLRPEDLNYWVKAYTESSFGYHTLVTVVL